MFWDIILSSSMSSSRHIPLGENIEISADVNFTVVTVLTPKVEEEVVEEEEAELEAGEGEEAGEAGEADETTEEK